jgi:hypothetical protein
MRRPLPNFERWVDGGRQQNPQQNPIFLAKALSIAIIHQNNILNVKGKNSYAF